MRNIWRIFFILIFLGLLSLVGLIGLGYFLYRDALQDLPPLDKIINYNPMRTSRVYSADRQLIGEFYIQNRIPLPWEKIPQNIKDAFIAAEDQDFYRHHGLDYQSVLRAVWTNYRSGHIVQGGSTITQQIVKVLVVGKEKSYRRKIRELILSFLLEAELTKEQILEIYLNEVYLGSGAYGVEAAAKIYFGKSAAELDLAQAAMIGGLAKAPGRDSPRINWEKAKGRQRYVLSQLLKTGKISAEEEKKAREEELTLKEVSLSRNKIAPYFVEHVRKYVVDKYGSDLTLKEGLEIHTTLMVSAQKAAEEAVRNGLAGAEKKYSGPSPSDEASLKEVETCLHRKSRKKILENQKEVIGNIRAIIINKDLSRMELCSGGVILSLNPEDSQALRDWKGDNGERIKVHQVINIDLKKVAQVDKTVSFEARLSRVSPLEAALISLDLETGAVLAMVGGGDFKRSEFNRTLQARRQAGSAIKSLIYAAAMENGFHEMSIVKDAPISINTAAGKWSPKNYKKEFLGSLTLRTAFAKSINTVSVRLALALELRKVIDYFKRLGITSPIPHHISIALGTIDVSLLEMTNIYSVFPRGGSSVGSNFITRISDSHGNIIEQYKKPLPVNRLSPEAAYLMVDLMKGVTKFGTGKKAKDFNRPVGGKTGTSTDYRDAWFIGFSHDIITGVWVGRDDFMPIGFDATGGRLALPIWLEFMEKGHPGTPVQDFEIPPGLVYHWVNSKTGKIADQNDRNGEMIPFKLGVEPITRIEETKLPEVK